MEHLRELITQLQLSGIMLKQGELMCRHTSFQIGGPAAVMTFPESQEQVAEIFRLSEKFGVRPAVLGAGTNMLAPDEGLDTLLLETRTGLTRIREVEDGLLEADCGVTMARLATLAMERGLSGLEFAHGIPGSLGGAVTMDAGADEGDMSMVVREVRCLTEEGERETVSGRDLDFSYRHSAFSDERRFILGATLELKSGDSAAIKALMDDLWNRRRHKQPLDVPSAGSTFKRPKGYFAAALIDECKLKGVKMGGAQVSTKHAGFLINAGGATCDDVLRLAEFVRETVRRETGVELELEVRTLGV